MGAFYGMRRAVPGTRTGAPPPPAAAPEPHRRRLAPTLFAGKRSHGSHGNQIHHPQGPAAAQRHGPALLRHPRPDPGPAKTEEHTDEPTPLTRIQYSVCNLNK